MYACELNETFAAMSCDILSTNGMQNQVKVISSPSTGLSVPNNLPTRCSRLKSSRANYCISSKPVRTFSLASVPGMRCHIVPAV